MDKKFLKQFFKSLISTSFGTLVTISIHFVSIMLLARHVSKEELGIYFLVLVIVNLASIMGGLGLNLSLVKFLSGEKELQNTSTVPAIFVLRGISLIVFSILIYSFGSMLLSHLDERINRFILYIPVIFIFTSLKDLFYNFLQGMQQFKKYVIIQISSAVLKLLLLIIFATLDRLNIYILIYIETSVLITIAFMQFWIIPFRTFFPLRLDSSTIRIVLKFSLPLYLNDILTVIHGRINVVIIGALLSPASVALYEIAQKIPEGFLRLFTSFIVVYFPNQSNLFAEGRKSEAENLLNKSLIFVSTGTIFFVLAAFLFSEQIIQLIFSDRFLEASFAFSLLMLSFFFRAISNIMGYSLVSAGYSSIPFKVNSVACIVNIIGSLMMIPKWGFIGAVYSLLLMNALSQVAYYFYLVRAKICTFRANFLNPLFIGIILFGLLSLYGENPIYLKFLLLAVYISVCTLIFKDFRDALPFIVKGFQKARKYC